MNYWARVRRIRATSEALVWTYQTANTSANAQSTIPARIVINTYQEAAAVVDLQRHALLIHAKWAALVLATTHKAHSHVCVHKDSPDLLVILSHCHPPHNLRLFYQQLRGIINRRVIRTRVSTVALVFKIRPIWMVINANVWLDLSVRIVSSDKWLICVIRIRVIMAELVRHRVNKQDSLLSFAFALQGMYWILIHNIL